MNSSRNFRSVRVIFLNNLGSILYSQSLPNIKARTASACFFRPSWQVGPTCHRLGVSRSLAACAPPFQRPPLELNLLLVASLQRLRQRIEIEKEQEKIHSSSLQACNAWDNESKSKRNKRRYKNINQVNQDIQSSTHRRVLRPPPRAAPSDPGRRSPRRSHPPSPHLWWEEPWRRRMRPRG
jgi:hypothetical protein